MGHVRAAEEFISAMKLDKLLVIPALIPPHKTDAEIIDPELRLRLCRLAFCMEKCEVSDIEIRRGGKSYTVLTLEELKKIYPSDELLFLCGTDMILTFDRWYRAEDIFRMCTVVYVRRENDDITERKIAEKVSSYSEQFGAEIRHISPRITELSSSEIRDLIQSEGDISELVPPAVAEFIRESGIYNRGDFCV